MLSQSNTVEQASFFSESPIDWITALTLVHTVGVLVVGVRIILIDYRKYLYRFFFALTILIFAMLWSNYELMRATDLQTASWFARLQQFFGYQVTALIVLTLWYYSRFSEVVPNKAIKNVFFFVILSVFLSFSILELTPLHYGKTIQLKNSHWGIIVEEIKVLDWLRFIGTSLAHLCAILFVGYSYYTARDKREKPIKLFLLVIIVLSLSLSLYQNYWVPMFSSFTVLNNESFTSFWGMLFFAWAFSDLKLFKIEPHRAVNDIISSMTNLMILCNNYFQIKDINQAAQVFFQKDLNQIQNLPIEAIIQNENWEYIKSRIYIQAHQFDKEELEITIEVDGKLRHLLLTITPFIEKNRKVGYIFIGTDLTAVEQALEKERQVAQLQNRFVSIASHQFRTPLTAVKLNTILLKRYLKSDPKTSEKKLTRFIDRIETEVDRLTVLMDDVLTLGKLESKKMNVQIAENDLVGIILELLDHDFSFQPDGRKMQLFVQTPPCKVMTDKKVIEHILINLISNAFKYSVNQKEPQIHVFFKQDYFKIKIIDFGIGIPQKDQGNLFKPFYRGSNTVQMQGSGLGLVIVKELVSLIQGEVTYESQEGVGSQFVITIKQGI